MADSSALLQDAKDVTLQRIQGETQIYDVITNRKQVNLSVCFRNLVHTTVWKEQNMSGGMQPSMAEEKTRVNVGTWTKHRNIYRESKGRG